MAGILVKHFWTLPTAAIDLGMSRRNLIRIVEDLGIPRAELDGHRDMYIFCQPEMDRLRTEIEERKQRRRHWHIKKFR